MIIIFIGSTLLILFVCKLLLETKQFLQQWMLYHWNKKSKLLVLYFKCTELNKTGEPDLYNSVFIWYYSVCLVCKGFLFLFAFVRDTKPPSCWDHLSAWGTSCVLPTAPNSQNWLKSYRYFICEHEINLPIQGHSEKNICNFILF